LKTTEWKTGAQIAVLNKMSCVHCAAPGSAMYPLRADSGGSGMTGLCECGMEYWFWIARGKLRWTATRQFMVDGTPWMLFYRSDVNHTLAMVKDDADEVREPLEFDGYMSHDRIAKLMLFL
jgi:hypothetical protein